MLRMFVICLFIAGCSSGSVPRDDSSEPTDAGDTFEDVSDDSETLDSETLETDESDTPVESDLESDTPSEPYTKAWGCLICAEPFSIK